MKACKSMSNISTASIGKYKKRIKGLLQKLQPKKETQTVAIQSFEHQYFSTHNTLPERRSNSAYESMVYEKNFITKLLQLIAKDAQLED